ncbi:MAG: FAD-dependent oxidoreductase [Phycisphaeraceae bacterium]|nr:FAD-dependent oxidoreductase [Phycisphaeraceae bacterium]
MSGDCTRRRFIGTGLGAVALGMTAPGALAGGLSGKLGQNAKGLTASQPFRPIPFNPVSVMIDGVPFAPTFSGDRFFNPHPGVPVMDKPPAPDEETDIIVVGGGMAGIASAYMLRDQRPILLEMWDRFGGNAQGENWRGTHYSLGSAYIIVPDKGSFLEAFYKDLKLDEAYRLSIGDDQHEIDGAVRDDLYAGLGLPPEQLQVYNEYSDLVALMGEDYPEIPYPKGDEEFIFGLDRLTFKEHVETTLGQSLPPLLEAAIQSYCYSSFCAGWEEISAASGWNFIAAEEFGRWVFPGGNAYMINQMWRHLARMTSMSRGGGDGGPVLRPGCQVVDIRLDGPDHVLVTHRVTDDALLKELTNTLRTIRARRVVCACPKHIAKHVLHDLGNIDPEKLGAMDALNYNAYLVANVLLRRPVPAEFYDIFLLGPEGDFPMSGGEMAVRRPVVDVLDGSFNATQGAFGVLTLYWPLPWGSSRFTLVNGGDSHTDYAKRLAAQLPAMLKLINLTVEDIVQVRLTQWGHAMPRSAPGFIAGGSAALVQRPIDDRIFFVHQDNWALPAVENGLLDAEIYLPQLLGTL